MTRITLVGPGAIGGVLASQLLRSGIDLDIVASPRGTPALRAQGLRVLEDGVLHTTRPRVTDDPAELGVQDLLLIGLKGHALAAAAKGLAPLVGPQTVIVPALNGIPWWFFEGFGGALEGRCLGTVDPTGDIQRALPARQCLGCVVYIASRTDADGVIHPGRIKQLVIGEPAPGTQADALARVASLFEGAGVDVVRSTDIRRDVWLKLWGNLTMNPLSAITGAPIDRMVDDPALLRLAAYMMEESRVLAARLGIELGLSTAERVADLRALGPIKTSMLQDFEAGRAPEIDVIVGAMAEIGDLLGIDTPYIDAVLALVRQLAMSRGLSA